MREVAGLEVVAGLVPIEYRLYEDQDISLAIALI
jgi:hypothetical protein